MKHEKFLQVLLAFHEGRENGFGFDEPGLRDCLGKYANEFNYRRNLSEGSYQDLDIELVGDHSEDDERNFMLILCLQHVMFEGLCSARVKFFDSGKPSLNEVQLYRTDYPESACLEYWNSYGACGISSYGFEEFL